MLKNHKKKKTKNFVKNKKNGFQIKKEKQTGIMMCKRYNL